jgi:hypothetical protein
MAMRVHINAGESFLFRRRWPETRARFEAARRLEQPGEPVDTSGWSYCGAWQRCSPSIDSIILLP